MMRSMYSAVSGLKTHQTKMDVIGNNIANVNTVAFKSSSVTFQDILYQTTSGASGSNATTGVGGVNAKQIGLGVSTGATSVSITSAGAAETTGNPFDLRLSDKSTTNFFIVNNGSENVFTRSGSFYVDGAGNLCMTSTGYTVMGWQVDPTTGEIRKDTVSALRVMQTANLTSNPEATTNATCGGVIDKNDTDVKSDNGMSKTLTFYDSLGYSYTARFAIKETGTAGQFSVGLVSILDSDGNTYYDPTDGKTYLDANGNPVNLNSLFGRADTTTKSYATASEYDSMTFDTTRGIVQDGNNWVIYDTGTAATDYNITDVFGLTAAQLAAIDAGDATASITGGVLSYTVTATGATTTYNAVTGYDTLTFADVASVPGTGVITSEAVPGTAHNIKEVFDGVSNDMIALLNTGATADYDAVTGKMTISYPTTDYKLNFNIGNGSFNNINGADSVSLNMSVFGPNFQNVDIDFTTTKNSNNGGKSTATMTSGDLDGTTGKGKKLGALIGLSVDQYGVISGTYDNGNTVTLGQIAVAQFANASGLEKVGDNCYTTTLNSGEFDGIGVEIAADGSKMTSGELEMSNVDLSTEFTQMIVTQRGFQANSRVITTSDTLLEELVNLKR